MPVSQYTNVTHMLCLTSTNCYIDVDDSSTRPPLVYLSNPCFCHSPSYSIHPSIHSLNGLSFSGSQRAGYFTLGNRNIPWTDSQSITDSLHTGLVLPQGAERYSGKQQNKTKYNIHKKDKKSSQCSLLGFEEHYYHVRVVCGCVCGKCARFILH